MLGAEEVLRELGVRITSASGDEIQGYCPVHASIKGREQDKPKWYLNSETGAWICFTCGQRGSLPHLVEALGGDKDTIDQLRTNAAITVTHRWQEEDEDGVLIEREQIVSVEEFESNPRPPVRVMDLKDVDPEVVEHFNVRWDAKGKCWLLPIYSFDGFLLGWQEKSKGYFMNVPKAVKKSESLFGWHNYRGGQLIVVESPLDALRLASYGYQAVAAYGSYPSDEQLAHLRLAESIVLAFDNDDAGDHATYVAYDYLRHWKSNIRFFNYPPNSRGKDPGNLSVPALHRGVDTAVLESFSVTTTKEQEQWQPRKQSGRRTRGAISSPKLSPW